MKKALVLFGFLLLAIFPAVAQDDNPAVQIDFPPSVYDLAGVVDITGTANPPDMQNYYVEMADYDPANPSAEPLWLPASLPNANPVEKGVLARIDTTLFPDGLYQLRLQVRLQSGESLYDVVTPLRIANGIERPEGQVVATQAPAATAAPIEPTVEPTAVPVTPVPRPQVTNTLPIELGGPLLGFGEDTVAFMQTAGMTWMKWQIPFTVGDDSLLTVALDRINHAHRNGFKTLLSIKGDKNEMAQIGEEEYFPLYAAFVGRVAAFAPEAIQVWNEQNLDREWPEGQIDPVAYVEMLRQASQAIKAVDPTIMVITGAPAPTGAEGAFGLAKVWNDDRYYQGMANAGVADYADCIGVHYNEGIIPPAQQGGDPRGNYPTYYFPLMINRAAFPFRSLDIPMCFTELGYLTPEGYGTLPGGFAWASNTSIQEQSEWLRDAVTIAANDGRVNMIIIWNVDYTRYDADPQAGYAIIRADGTGPAGATIGSLQE